VRRSGIPAEVEFQTKWQLALELIDEAQAWGLRCGVVLADAGYGKSRNSARDWRLATFLMRWASLPP